MFDTTCDTPQKKVLRKLNDALLGADILVRKEHGGIDYISLSDKFRAAKIDMKVHMPPGTDSVRLSLRTYSDETYETFRDMIGDALSASDDEDLSDIEMYHDRIYFEPKA